MRELIINRLKKLCWIDMEFPRQAKIGDDISQSSYGLWLETLSDEKLLAVHDRVTKACSSYSCF